MTYLSFIISAYAGIVSQSEIKDPHLQSQQFVIDRKGCQLKSFRMETFTEEDLNLFGAPGKMVSTAMIAAFEMDDQPSFFRN